ncbi:hypothetical protein [Magnetococcus sp. PR-3]|uniref:hypothetical protein n=1 Tax=Magnetococcus sp. PR-3 TaxID=3120355 RepID=UPI002FCE1709
MTIATWVAQIIGPLYLMVALGMVLDPKRYQELIEIFLESPVWTYMGGVVALSFGLVIINIHNVWVLQWPVLITILGWLALFKGAMLILYPAPVLRLSRSWFTEPHDLLMVAIGAGSFGLLLTVLGYA